tara:strand:+ start:266 stop:664 length:399 start_codon:yes stop_codon:yes gene_type:complete
MSSNLKIASFDGSVLAYKIVTDSSIGAAGIIDVMQAGGSLRDITLDLATGINNNYYLKLWLQTASVVVGGNTGTPPDMIIKADQDQIIRMNFPGGIPFSALSAALVDGNVDTSDAQTTTNNSGTVKITMVVA